MIQLFLLLISFCVFKNLVCMESSKLKDENQFFPNSIIPFVKGGCRMFKGRNQDCFLSEPAALAVNDWINKNPQHVINYAKNHDLEVLSEKTVNELELLRQSFEEQKKIQLKCDTLKNELEEKEKLILELNQNVKGHKDQEKAAAELMQELSMAKSKLLQDAEKLKVIEESNQSENLILKGQNKDLIQQNKDLLQLNKEISDLNSQLIEQIKKRTKKLKQFSEKVQLVQGKEQLKTRNKSKSIQLNSRNYEQKRDKTVSLPSNLKQSQVRLVGQLAKKEQMINELNQKINELSIKLYTLSDIPLSDKQDAELISDLRNLNGEYALLSEKYENTSKELESSKTALTKFKEMNDLLLKQLENNALNFDNINVKHQESITGMGKLRTVFKNNISSLENCKTKLQEESAQKDRFIAKSKILNYVLILGISLFSCRNLIKNGFCKIWELRHAVPSVSFKMPNITFSGFSNPFASFSIGDQIALRWTLLRNYLHI